jgi:peptide/nickel transport system substrate-binding protein
LRSWHWSDGVPVSAADVVYSFGIIKALDGATVGNGSNGFPGIIRTLTALDATHLKIELNRRANPSWFAANCLDHLIPVPQHDWSRYDIDQLWQAQTTPAFFSVIDGPLRVARLDPDQDAVFIPNPAYEGTKMHFQRLIFPFLDNNNAGVQGVASGDLDFAGLANDLWKAAQNLPGTYLVAQPAIGWSNIVLNFRNPATPFFDDVRVRQAMEDSIDQSDMIKVVFHGTGSPVYAPLPALPLALLSPEFRSGNLPVGYDRSSARKLLEQAGYRPGPDGVMRKDGHSLTFVMLYGAGDSDELQETEFVQANLRQTGIDMRVRSIEFDQMLALLDGPPAGWQAALVNIAGGSYPSGATLFATGGAENFGGYSDEKMDALIEASEYDTGLDGLFAYEDYIISQQPSITFASPANMVLVRDRLRGVAKFIDAETNQYPDLLHCTKAYP